MWCGWTTPVVGGGGLAAGGAMALTLALEDWTRTMNAVRKS